MWQSHPWCDALGCLRLDSPPGAAHQSAGQPAPMGVSAGCFADAGRGRHSVDPRVTVKMKLVTAKTQLRVVMERGLSAASIRLVGAAPFSAYHYLKCATVCRVHRTCRLVADHTSILTEVMSCKTPCAAHKPRASRRAAAWS